MPRGRRRRRGNRPATNPTGRRGIYKPVSIKHANDLHAKNQEANLTDHFDSPKHLVLRRGCTFEFIVDVSSLSDVKENSVTFELHRGPRARYSRGTMFQGVCSVKSKRFYQWKMEVLNSGSNSIRYRLSVPPDAPVGGYKGYIRLPTGRNKPDSVWEMEREIVILFNPWRKDDDVYLPKEEERYEYVLNETGLIWAGTYRDSFTWPWNYAQFETTSLEAVLHMMDMWNLGSDARRSPITVSRCMAEMVNRNDHDGGILEGLWSANEEDYADGVDPTSWSGSELILRHYMETRRPVKYAQCWVFGGTLTTTLRTLGIPARPITNFESAHDADFNRAIDYYYDRNNKALPDRSGDSIWNYHVWVEGWMARPDLEGNHGGWQALDATPQELSPHSKSMVVGPASIQAIKDGLDLKYDNEFVIAEVNADIKWHYENKKGEFIVMASDTTTVGTHISTKAVGGDRREDITLHYKYREGSVAERAALLGKGSSNEDGTAKPFKFEAELISKKTLGSDLIFEVKTTSTSAREASVKITGVFEHVTYTGIVGKEIKRQTRSFKGHFLPGSAQKHQFKVSFQELLDSLGEQATLMGTFLAYVEDHDDSWISRVPVRLELPIVDINVDKRGNKNVSLKGLRSADVTASFKNPLNKPLTNVSFYIEGTGLLAAKKMDADSVPVKGTCSIKFPVIPRAFSQKATRNKVTLIVTAKSKQLKGIMGTATINIVQ